MMNRFWKKQLPAALLTLVLMIGLVPAAMAEGTCPETGKAHSWDSWETTTPATCTESGVQRRKCKDCDAVDTTAIAALGHDFSGEGTVTKSPTCTEGGTMRINCSRCAETTTRAIAKLGHSYVSGVCNVCGAKDPSAGSSSKSATVSVTPSSSTTVGKTICTAIGKFETIKFGKPSGTTYGKLYATSSKTALSTAKSYKYTDVAKLYFVATSKSGTYTVDYTATKSDKTTVKGTISIKVAAVSNGTITYQVKAGESVDFRSADFKALYEESLDGDVNYVKLSTDATISTSKGTVYYDYESADEYGKAFSKSTLKDYDFYFSKNSYDGGNAKKYSISTLSFAAPKDAKAQTIKLSCEVFDLNGKSVKGTVKIVISAGSSSSTSGETITYKVKAGKTVDFDADDFEDLYDEAGMDGIVSHVSFSTSDTLSKSKGTVYYDYKGDDQKDFTASSIGKADFYFTYKGYAGDRDDDEIYDLDELTFVAPDDAEARTITLKCKIYDDDGDYAEGKVKIVVDGGTASTGKNDGGEITYTVKPGSSILFKPSDFSKAYDAKLDDEACYVTFATSNTINTTNGTVYYNYKGTGSTAFDKSSLKNQEFYFDDDDYGDYALEKTGFVAPEGAKEQTIVLTAKIYDSDDEYVTVKVNIIISKTASVADTADIVYHVEANSSYDFSRTDFNEFFQEKYSNYTIKYVTFETDEELTKNTGMLYVNYDGKNELAIYEDDLEDLSFYYSDADEGDYALNKLTFVTGKNFTEPMTLNFTAYYSDSRKVSGALVITPEKGITAVGGDIMYLCTYSSNLQLNANDFARFLKSKYPSSTLTSVRLKDVPAIGSMYYNYYGTSPNGLSKYALTSSNCSSVDLYLNPTSTSQFSLSELTYIPKGLNYCASIPFTAYGTNNKSVDGTVLISVSISAVPEVYVTSLKNKEIALPASSIAASVFASTGTNPTSIQFTKLPDSSRGTLYVGSGTSHKASLTEVYGTSTGVYKLSQLRFVPASNFTGSVELPYVALNSNGTAVAAGKICLGVLAAQKTFTDIPASTWCYKYVTELSSAGIIGGYADNTFKEKSTITYGAALKLVMLAAGYPEQAPINSNVFSGYLAKAQADGLITKKNVNLAGPITRLQIAQLAAAALKLDTTNLSAVQPFTDTTDASVRALNAAGIIEGYFANGTSTFKPNNTLTRGHVSAIVWRMRNLNK